MPPRRGRKNGALEATNLRGRESLQILPLDHKRDAFNNLLTAKRKEFAVPTVPLPAEIKLIHLSDR